MRTWIADVGLGCLHRLSGSALFAGLAGVTGDPRGLWILAVGAGALTALATLASMLLVIQRLIRETRAVGDGAPPPESGERAETRERHLAEVSRQLTDELRQVAATLGEELRGSLRHEAQSLSEGLRQDRGRGLSPRRRLCREIAGLPDDERRPLTATIDAAGRLGEWIERLCPLLQTSCDAGQRTQRGRDEATARLPEAAAGEWRQAVRTLRAFSRSDATALRRLSGAGADDPPGLADTRFLEGAGLLADDRPVTERLKRYLEPFDHPGRLGEVTLALQYLIEAYPIEQLPRDRRARWRRELSEVQSTAGEDEDFHRLVARIAAGIGLRYRPVPYYRSRTDQSEYAFVRQQVSPISLSERVGFEATADKEVIVRLERPFFFQLETDIYYAGHAHVAR